MYKIWLTLFLSNALFALYLAYFSSILRSFFNFSFRFNNKGTSRMPLLCKFNCEFVESGLFPYILLLYLKKKIIQMTLFFCCYFCRRGDNNRCFNNWMCAQWAAELNSTCYLFSSACYNYPHSVSFGGLHIQISVPTVNFNHAHTKAIHNGVCEANWVFTMES